MNWLTHFRTLTVAVGAFTFCCGLVTQILARALGDAPQLGPAIFAWSGLRFYAPFSFLTWSFAWARYAPTLLVLCICMALVCALAAYAIAIVCAKLEPVMLADASPWRDLASWPEIGHYGLLRDEGLALGALRRHGLARTRIVRNDAHDSLILGDPKHTDDAFLAALQSWRGALVLIESRDRLAQRLGRSDVQRFAPARSDTLCFNPLLALRGGLEAWDDGQRLALILLNGANAPRDEPTIRAFALLIFNELLCAPLEARSLAALRRRLINPAALIAELCGRWAAEPEPDAPPVIWEMARVARAIRSEPDAALTRLTSIDSALAIFADAGIAHATDAHQLKLTQFGAAPGAQTLVLSMAGVRAESRSIVCAMLAQLVAVRAGDPSAPGILIACDAAATTIMAKQFPATWPMYASTRTVIQAVDVADAERLSGQAVDTASIVAIGPQTEPSADFISKRAGLCARFGTTRPFIPRWRDLLFPTWVHEMVPRLPTAALQTAEHDEAFLMAPNQKPVRMRVLVGGGATTFAAQPAPATHDWSAPPIDLKRTRAAVSPSAMPATAGATSAAKLRQVLTRTSAKPTNRGARTK